jgi:hypothetical protein
MIEYKEKNESTKRSKEIHLAAKRQDVGGNSHKLERKRQSKTRG